MNGKLNRVQCHTVHTASCELNYKFCDHQQMHYSIYYLFDY